MSAYREESVVRASYALEPEELEREWAPAFAAHQRAARLAVAATAALGGAVFLFTLPRGVAHVALVVGGALAAWAVLRSRSKSSVEDAYHGLWEDRRHVELEADETEIAFADSLSEERAAWDVVLHWRETEHSFLIYTSPQGFHVIPKRVFATKEQATTLRQLLTDRVRDGGAEVIDAVARTAVIPWAAYQVGIALVLLSVVEGVARLLSAWF